MSRQSHSAQRRHTSSAWLAFALLAAAVLAMPPLARPANAQLPDELPVPSGEDDAPAGGLADDLAGEDEPDAGDGEGGGQQAEDAPPAGGRPGPDQDGYWTNRTSAVLPAIATSEFPPGVLCILAPEFCSEDAQQISGPVQDALLGGRDAADEATEGAPQPVPGGTMPVGLLSGELRYASGIGVSLPDLPADREVDTFTLTVHRAAESFATESPAFRELIAAVVAQAGEESGPEPFIEALQLAAEGDVSLLETEITGVEACAITTPWQAAENQGAELLPEIDPIYCVDDPEPTEDGVHTFDLSFAANDHYAGVIDLHGVLLRPLFPANLAYGDPDFSTNFILYFAGPDAEDPEIRPAYAFSDRPAPQPPPPLEGPAGGLVGGATGGSGLAPAPGGGLGGLGGLGGGVTSGAPALAPPDAPGGADVATPEAVPDQGQEEVAIAEGPVAPIPEFAPIAQEQPASSAWVPWVLLPLLLGGAWWYGRVLGSPPPDVVGRAGAMTRLLRQRGFVSP